MTFKVVNIKKCKTKISCSDSHANETHSWPGEHRLKSTKKKKNYKCVNFRALTIILYVYTCNIIYKYIIRV
jgi:hypothetical protein